MNRRALVFAGPALLSFLLVTAPPSEAQEDLQEADRIIREKVRQGTEELRLRKRVSAIVAPLVAAQNNIFMPPLVACYESIKPFTRAKAGLDTHQSSLHVLPSANRDRKGVFLFNDETLGFAQTATDPITLNDRRVEEYFFKLGTQEAPLGIHYAIGTTQELSRHTFAMIGSVPIGVPSKSIPSPSGVDQNELPWLEGALSAQIGQLYHRYVEHVDYIRKVNESLAKKYGETTGLYAEVRRRGPSRSDYTASLAPCEGVPSPQIAAALRTERDKF